LIATGPPDEAVELSFEPLREGWSVYRTNDELTATISLKMILLKLYLLSIEESGNARFSANVRPIFTVSVPRERKGPKSTRAHTPQELDSAVVEEDVKFDTIKEDWNEYKLPENVMLSAKLVLTLASRTSLYDVNGDPIYRVQHQSIIKATNVRGAREKYLQIMGQAQKRADLASTEK
jgi:hypothetical protein